MEKNSSENNPDLLTDSAPSAVSPLSGNDTAFIREQIKARPVNKRKLFRRTMFTLILAILFGGVACLTFLLLEPVFSSRITPEEEPQIVTFPTTDDEIKPEDLYADDAEIASVQEQIVAESIQASIEASETDRVNDAIAAALARYTLDQDKAAEIFRSLKVIASRSEQSLVQVQATAKEDAFTGGTVEQSSECPGIIIADNGIEMLILTYTSILDEDSVITVNWCSGETDVSVVKMADTDSGLCILSVPKRAMTEATKKQIRVAALGSSLSTSLTGTPVIAVGSPIGIYRSVCYGTITSEKTPVDLPDKAMKVFATDIFGGGNSAGFLLNYQGQIVGIIYPGSIDGVDEKRILAYSITESKKLIENLVNANELPYLGIHGSTIGAGLSEELGIPSGAFVSRVDMDSPAMSAGLQSGDIIISADSKDISSWDSFIAAIENKNPGDSVLINIRRQGPEGYISILLTLTFNEVEQ